jgi:hypothetical protein
MTKNPSGLKNHLPQFEINLDEVAWSHDCNWNVMIDFMCSVCVRGVYCSQCFLKAQCEVPASEDCTMLNAS